MATLENAACSRVVARLGNAWISCRYVQNATMVTQIAAAAPCQQYITGQKAIQLLTPMSWTKTEDMIVTQNRLGHGLLYGNACGHDQF